MASIDQLYNFIQKNSLQKSNAQLALLNFLKFFCSKDQALEPNVLTQFYRHSLGLSYWRNHVDSLTSATQLALQNFSESESLSFDIDPYLKNKHMQVVDLEHTNTPLQLIENFQHRNMEVTQYRLIPISGNEILSLFKNSQGLLIIEVFAQKAMIVNAELLPLYPLSHMAYDQGLEFSPHHLNWIQLDPFKTLTYQVADSKISGAEITGNTFECSNNFSGNMIDFPELFYKIKKIEQNYISPETDPFYQEVLSLLEQASYLLNQGHANAPRLAEAALKKGKIALHNIFLNDKLILLKVTQIEYALTQISRARKPSIAQPIQPPSAQLDASDSL